MGRGWGNPPRLYFGEDMSNTTEKLAIANKTLLSVGNSVITSLTVSSTNTPEGNKIGGIFEEVVKELLGDDWVFSRKRVGLEDLTQIYKLVIDATPSPANFIIGKTLTESISGITCIVIDRLNSTTYLVTEPSGDFTGGKTLSDGTNSRVCATGYPTVDDGLDLGGWSYGFQMPAEQLYIRGLGDEDYDKVKYPYHREGKIILTNIDDAYWHYNRWIGENESVIVSDVTVMPIWFHRLISARLAHILSPNITQNQHRESKVEIELAAAWLDAREHNGSETYYEDEQGNTDWRDGANNELQSL